MKSGQKKISIICVGEDHRDPVAKKAILSAIKKFRKSNIPVVFCPEKPFETTLVMQCEDLNERIEILEGIIKTYHLDNFFYKPNGQPYPYFDRKNEEKLKDALEKSGWDLREGRLQMMMTEFIRLRTKYAERELLTFLLESKQGYVPIDIQECKINSLVEKLNGNASELDHACSYENERITIMVEHIKKATQLLKDTGGIILCNVGVLHAHRLAVNLQVQCKQEAVALYCYSDYGADDTLTTLEMVNDSKSKVDGNEILQRYETTQFTPLHFRINAQGALFNEAFDIMVSSYISKNDSKQSNFLSQSFVVYGGAIALFGLFCARMFSKTNNQTSFIPTMKM